MQRAKLFRRTQILMWKRGSVYWRLGINFGKGKVFTAAWEFISEKKTKKKEEKIEEKKN